MKHEHKWGFFCGSGTQTGLTKEWACSNSTSSKRVGKTAYGRMMGGVQSPLRSCPLWCLLNKCLDVLTCCQRVAWCSKIDDHDQKYVSLTKLLLSLRSRVVKRGQLWRLRNRFLGKSTVNQTNRGCNHQAWKLYSPFCYLSWKKENSVLIQIYYLHRAVSQAWNRWTPTGWLAISLRSQCTFGITCRSIFNGTQL